MAICLFILLAVIVVPMRINGLVEQLSLWSRFGGRFKRPTARHVVVTGLFDHHSLQVWECSAGVVRVSGAALEPPALAVQGS